MTYAKQILTFIGRFTLYLSGAWCGIVVAFYTLDSLGVWDEEEERRITIPTPEAPPPPAPEMPEEERLGKAMCAYLLYRGVGPAECERRRVKRLAKILVEVVSTRERFGQWIPINREEAPAFLAAVAFHEVSWRWDSAPEGSLGEGCAFQLNTAAIAYSDATKDEIKKDIHLCASAAIRWMELGYERCGGGPMAWLGWYASRGICNAAPSVIQKRIDTTQWLFAMMEDLHGGDEEEAGEAVADVRADQGASVQLR